METQIREVARYAGIQVDWVDAYGRQRVLTSSTIRHVLACMGLADRREDLERLRSQAAAAPTFMTAVVGQTLTLPTVMLSDRSIFLRDWHGKAHVLSVDSRGQCIVPATLGYYTIEHMRHRATLAVTPPRCFGIADATGTASPRVWGLTAQVYGLEDPGGGGLGSSRAVGDMACRIAALGGDALCLSPLHAMPPITSGYSPYSPSDRCFLDWVYTDPCDLLGLVGLHAALEATGLSSDWQRAEENRLIDWPSMYSMRRTVWRTLYQMFESASPVLRDDLLSFQRQGGGALRAHTLFAARQAWAAAQGTSVSWRDWPKEWAERGNAIAGSFASTHEHEVQFEAFLQWAAARAWDHASARARSGMKIGLISDVAVGFDPGGSEAWRNRDAVLRNLTLGAPPDAFNTKGQGWGVTSYAPQALRETHYAPFLELLRSNMRRSGGIRLDHVLGVSRLWVVPDGEAPNQGAYLEYPSRDLLRLVALESWLHRCIVIGEDLGTVPPDLRANLAESGILGTEVLLFNKDEKGNFLRPPSWRMQAAATTTTHDLPPLSSWEKGLDIDAAQACGLSNAVEASASVEARHTEVQKLQDALRAAGSVHEGDSKDRINDSALRHVARSRSMLVLVPMEDVLGLTEQPNVPGTVEEHPNWRQRLPTGATDGLGRPAGIVNSARNEGACDD